MCGDYSMVVADFYQKHAGCPGWIIGNGPSLLEMDLGHLQDSVTFGANRIYKYDGFVPKYYCIEDWLLMRQIRQEIDEWEPDVIKFIPTDLLKYLTIKENVIPVNFIREKNPKHQYAFSADCAKAVYWGSTVTFMMLQLSVYMGCNPIYLLGMDGIKSGKPKHFYEQDGVKNNTAKYDKVNTAMNVAVSFCAGAGVEIFNATPNPVTSFWPLVKYEDVVQ